MPNTPATLSHRCILLIFVLLLALSLLSACTRSENRVIAAEVRPTATAQKVTAVTTTTPQPRRVVAPAPTAAPAVQRAPVEVSRLLNVPRLSTTTNVLVLGSDRRPNTPNWRTDVIMIVALDMKGGVAGVISLPRDIYIEAIPDHQPNKINVVDYLGEKDSPDGGGPALLGSIITTKTGIPIHYYLRFDFEGFKKVIDVLDGLEITLDCPVRDYLPEEDVSISLQPGVHRLNGKEALAYVRSRAQGGDLDRSRRQQRVLWAVRDQIRRENLISRVPALYSALHESVQTDINLVSAIRFVRFALALDEDDVHGFVVSPPELIKEDWRGGMFVFVADWEKISTQAENLFDRPPLMESNLQADDGKPKCP